MESLAFYEINFGRADLWLIHLCEQLYFSQEKNLAIKKAPGNRGFFYDSFYEFFKEN
jgi:hypothetical protein